MYEVELKVRADIDGMEPILRSREAVAEGSVEQVDTYYDAPHRDFAETDEALRVRRERADGGETVELTYKGPLVETESKTREEHETAVTDEDAVGDILDSLGFEPAAEVRKERDRWTYQGYTVTLDRVEGLGEFVEVETETTEDNVERARDGACEVLKSLGLDPTEHLRTSYLGLLLEEASRDSQQ